jgi:hypothetical protein
LCFGFYMAFILSCKLFFLSIPPTSSSNKRSIIASACVLPISSALAAETGSCAWPDKDYKLDVVQYDQEFHRGRENIRKLWKYTEHGHKLRFW